MDEAYADIGRSRQRADKGLDHSSKQQSISGAALTRQAINGADGATEGSPIRRKRAENGEGAGRHKYSKARARRPRGVHLALLLCGLDEERGGEMRIVTSGKMAQMNSSGIFFTISLMVLIFTNTNYVYISAAFVLIAPTFIFTPIFEEPTVRQFQSSYLYRFVRTSSIDASLQPE